MLNKDNYVPWSSRLIRYAKSKPNGKFLVNSINNGPYVRQIIHEPGDPNSVPPVAESTHEQTNDELTDQEADSEKKDIKLFNEWEKFKSTDGESIESYYHCFSKLMHDFSREKHFPVKIASNLKFLNNLQPESNRSVTTVHQTKDLYQVDYTQLYDLLKLNQAENGYNAVKNVKNRVVQNAVQNLGGNNDITLIDLYLIKSNGNNGIQLQAEEFDLMAAAGDIDYIEDVNANCVLMANLHQASTSGIQIGKAPIYDSDGTSE
ncbi:hypothetical protein Tco_1066070, partial [Tanacetum coccineum]